MLNFLSKYKSIFYLCNFILITLYLFPGSLLGCFLYNDCGKQPQITKDFIVSANHFYAFIILSIVGHLTFKKLSQFKFINYYLIFLSIILEILQKFTPERSFEFPDLFGNFAGVIVTISIFYFLKKNEKFKN